MLNQSQVDHVNKSLEMLQVFPVIVICDACDSGNVITNPCCCQCGIPLGQIVENTIEKYEKKTKKKSYKLDISPSVIAVSSASYMSTNPFFVRPSLSVSPSASESYSISPSESEPPDFWGEEIYEEKDLTPVYNSCANCWTLNNIRENTACPACGVLTSIEEIAVSE